MLKRVAQGPGYLKAAHIEGIYSVSGCISKEFYDYITLWRHNKHYFFDSPKIIQEICSSEKIDPNEMEWFFYEIYENEFDEIRGEWRRIRFDEHFSTNVVIPKTACVLGFDLVSF